MLGVTLRAAKTQSGSARMAAAVVPMAAIATVSAVRRSSTRSSSVAGGHALAAQPAILGNPVSSFAGSTRASCQLTE
jgi:hypothetical protein